MMSGRIGRARNALDILDAAVKIKNHFEARLLHYEIKQNISEINTEINARWEEWREIQDWQQNLKNRAIQGKCSGAPEHYRDYPIHD
jgi:hypothetical protein